MNHHVISNSPVRISAVTYLNTKPFIYGIENSGFLENYTLDLDTPAQCAEKLLTGRVDLGLVPVAIIPQLEKFHILTDYCIGAENAVKSVMIFSECPLNEIKEIMLDYQSGTSVLLTQLLAKKYWKINPLWTNAKIGYETDIKGKTAGVVIGDRALGLQNKFPFSYDLAEEWHKFTSLPFVFACWIANKQLPRNFITSFEKAIDYGVNYLKKVSAGISSEIDVYDYLSNYISYNFDSRKKKGLELFLKYINELK